MLKYISPSIPQNWRKKRKNMSLEDYPHPGDLGWRLPDNLRKLKKIIIITQKNDSLKMHSSPLSAITTSYILTVHYLLHFFYRSGQKCKFFQFLLSLNSQRRLGYKENNIKYRSLPWKHQSHVRILIYHTCPIYLLRVYMANTLYIYVIYSRAPTAQREPHTHIEN